MLLPTPSKFVDRSCYRVAWLALDNLDIVMGLPWFVFVAQKVVNVKPLYWIDCCEDIYFLGQFWGNGVAALHVVRNSLHFLSHQPKMMEI